MGMAMLITKYIYKRESKEVIRKETRYKAATVLITQGIENFEMNCIRPPDSSRGESSKENEIVKENNKYSLHWPEEASSEF